MSNNDTSFPISLNEINKDENDREINKNEINYLNNQNSQNVSNINPQNYQNKEKEIEIEEMDEIENLRFKDNINNNNLNTFIKQRLDSTDSAAHYKFSIDLPNVSKQRLHEYLNDDLLNALEFSPNIPNLNNGISNNKQIPYENKDDNPNNLFGFSLYPQSNDNDNNLDNDKNNKNNNNLSDFNNINSSNNTNNTNNANNVSNMNNMNNSNNVNNISMNNNFGSINNYNNIQNYNYINNINLNGNLNYYINNAPIYIPSNLRNKEQINNKEMMPVSGQQNTQINTYQNQKKEEHINSKNKFDVNKKNQNSKKDKNKKHFEVRAGDWTCTKCNNLNFSFRNKCNRCGLPKELNKNQMNPEILSQNPNYQLMNGINSNFAFGNKNVNNNVNIINNPNNVYYYPK